MDREIMVSVLCTAFNHERYIRRCLDGLLAQQTDFAYEIIVHDDASSDNTADIIREYQNKYPDIMRCIYQKENQYSKNNAVVYNFLFPEVRGKYIAMCEGDDYWTDVKKLQKQVTALENNPSCHMCVCGTEIVKEDGSPTGRRYPVHPIQGGVLTSREFMNAIKTYNFQTSGYLRVFEDAKHFFESNLEFIRVSDVGDEPMLLYFASIGNIYYVNDVMSCYRQNSAGSWSSRKGNNASGIIKHCESMIAMINAFDKYSKFKYHDICEERVRIQEFNMNLAQEKYKTLLLEEYRSIYKSRSKKVQMIILLKAHHPKLFEAALNIRRKLKLPKIY